MTSIKSVAACSRTLVLAFAYFLLTNVLKLMTHTSMLYHSLQFQVNCIGRNLHVRRYSTLWPFWRSCLLDKLKWEMIIGMLSAV